MQIFFFITEKVRAVQELLEEFIQSLNKEKQQIQTDILGISEMRTQIFAKSATLQIQPLWNKVYSEKSVTEM